MVALLTHLVAMAMFLIASAMATRRVSALLLF